MGFECSAIRQYGRSNPRIKSGGRAIGIAWKAIGWFATADRDRGLPPHGCLTRAASGTRSKRDGTTWCGDRHVRHPPFLLTAEVPAASEGVKAFAPFLAGRSVRNPRGLISRDRPEAGLARLPALNEVPQVGKSRLAVQPRDPQPDTGSAIRTGWCRRRAVNAVPAGKRFDSVHFPPIACANALMADVAGRPST